MGFRKAVGFERETHNENKQLDSVCLIFSQPPATR